MVDSYRHRPSESIIPSACGHAIQEQSGHRIGDSGDDAQQVDVAHLSLDEPREWPRDHVESGRVWKRVTAGCSGREIEISSKHALESMRVKQRIPDRHIRVQQDQKLEKAGPG